MNQPFNLAKERMRRNTLSQKSARRWEPYIHRAAGGSYRILPNEMPCKASSFRVCFSDAKRAFALGLYPLSRPFAGNLNFLSCIPLKDGGVYIRNQSVELMTQAPNGVETGPGPALHTPVVQWIPWWDPYALQELERRIQVAPASVEDDNVWIRVKSADDFPAVLAWLRVRGMDGTPDADKCAVMVYPNDTN